MPGIQYNGTSYPLTHDTTIMGHARKRLPTSRQQCPWTQHVRHACLQIPSRVSNRYVSMHCSGAYWDILPKGFPPDATQRGGRGGVPSRLDEHTEYEIYVQNDTWYLVLNTRYHTHSTTEQATITTDNYIIGKTPQSGPLGQDTSAHPARIRTRIVLVGLVFVFRGKYSFVDEYPRRRHGVSIRLMNDNSIKNMGKVFARGRTLTNTVSKRR